MRLYHGSNVEVTVPDLTKSKPYKDFGRGFYLSVHSREVEADSIKTWSSAKPPSIT